MTIKNGQYLYKNQTYNQDEIKKEKEAKEAKLREK